MNDRFQNFETSLRSFESGIDSQIRQRVEEGQETFNRESSHRQSSQQSPSFHSRPERLSTTTFAPSSFSSPFQPRSERPQATTFVPGSSPSSYNTSQPFYNTSGSESKYNSSFAHLPNSSYTSLNSSSHTAQWTGNRSTNGFPIQVGQRLTDHETSRIHGAESYGERLQRSLTATNTDGSSSGPVTMTSLDFADRLNQAKIEGMDIANNGGGYGNHVLDSMQQAQNKSRLEAERKISTLSPLTLLNNRIRQNNFKGQIKLSSSLASYPAWCEHFNSTLSACYLQCIALIDARRAPRTAEEWIQLDNHHETKSTMSMVRYAFENGKVPSPSENDSISALNAIFLTVCDVYPMVLHVLHDALRSSLDHSMLFLKPSQEVDTMSFRVIFFGAHKHFLVDSSTAKATSLIDFMKNSPYKIAESIDAFFKRLLVKAKRVNTVHGYTAVSETMIWTIFFQSVKEVMGDRYDSIIDTYRREPDFASNSMRLLVQIVSSMNDKFTSQKKHVIMDEWGNYAAEDRNLRFDNSSHQSYFAGGMKYDQSYYAGGSSTNTSIKVSNMSSPSNLPCFIMRKNGSCRFGSKCKYSHDPAILNRPDSSPVERAAMLEEQLQNMYLTCAAIHQQKSAYKKSYLKHRPSSSSRSLARPTGPNGGKNFVSTYQAAVKSPDASANAAVTEEKSVHFPPDDDDIPDGDIEETSGEDLSYSTEEEQ
jgi:hypothetical protein